MSSVADRSSSDYFYAENYYDYAVQLRAFNGNNTDAPSAHGNSLMRLVLTILLRIGFVFMQLGSVPINNVNLILLQNVADFCCATVMFLLTGFLVAYNGDVANLIGEGRWIGDPIIDKNEAIAGWQAIVIASAIYTTAVAGRMHVAAYLLVGVLLSGLIQPLLIHWAWSDEGWMARNELAGRKVGFRDHAGTAVIHVVGGLTGLIGCLVLGRRMLRLKDLDDASVSPGSVGSAFGGLLLVLAGLQGLYMNESDKSRTSARDPSHAYVNNLLAAASCTLLVMALHFAFGREALDHWIVMRCVQGMLAGVVAVSAAANDYSPQLAIALGCQAAIVFSLVSRQVFRSALEDYCNVVAVHFACAVFGSLMAPFYAVHFQTEDGMALILDFCWQLICLAALFALVGVTMWIVFSTLKVCGILRNKPEWQNHMRAHVVANRKPPKSIMRKLLPDSDNPVYLQPGSISGTKRPAKADVRFSTYQTELDNLENRRFTNRPVMHVGRNNVTQVQPFDRPLGTRIKKARQVHTLSANMPVLMEVQGGTGESVNHHVPQVVRKQFLGREMKRVLDPIEEIDEEYAKEYEIQANDPRCDIKNRMGSVDNRDSISSKGINTFAPTGHLNELNYQLRRTVKLINLHREFSKQDLRVVLESKRMDCSSSDSCDQNVVFAKTSDINESAREIAMTPH